MVAVQKSQKKLTAREKKIISNKLEDISSQKLADIWKINIYKDLNAAELEQFNMIRKKYKELTGKVLPEHSNTKK